MAALAAVGAVAGVLLVAVGINAWGERYARRRRVLPPGDPRLDKVYWPAALALAWVVAWIVVAAVVWGVDWSSSAPPCSGC